MRVTRPDWLAEKKLAAPITIARERQPDFPDSPSIAEFAKDKDERTHNVLELIFKILEIDRPFMAPPEVSGARLAVLRTAFERMMKDPAFSDEGRKLNLELVFGSGEHLAQAVDWIYTMPQDVIMDAGGDD